MDRQARDELAARLQAENAATLADVMARRERDLLFGDCTVAAPAVTKAIPSVRELEEAHRADVAQRQQNQQTDLGAWARLLDAHLDATVDSAIEYVAEQIAPLTDRISALETQVMLLRKLATGEVASLDFSDKTVTRHVA